MIASPALSLTPPVPVPAGTLPGEAGEAANGADFLTLLAQTVDQANVSGASVSDPLAAVVPAQADPAAAMPAAIHGKILPPPLPGEVKPQQETAQVVETETAPQPVIQPARFIAQPVKPGAPMHAEPRKAEPPEKAVADSAEASAPAEIDAAIAIVAGTSATPVTLQALPAQAASAAIEHRPDQAGQNDTVPGQLVRLQVPGAENRPVTDPRQAPSALVQVARQISHQAPAAPQQAAQNTAQPQSAPPPLAQVRIEVAMPQPLKQQQAPLVRALAATASLLREETGIESSALLPVSAPQAAPLLPLATLPAAPISRPQDFAALIDRLFAAREAAAPQAISVSLPHADFGRVQLHFRQDDAGLAVSLTSSDPDFARIAAQAAPPILPLSEARNAENASQQASTRSDGQGAQASQNGGQRGQSQDRRSDGHARSDHQPRSRAAPDQGEQRSGIYA